MHEKTAKLKMSRPLT